MALHILAIIPAYNEEQSISDVIAGLARSALGPDILVVNDGSHDGTSSAARATGTATVIDLPLNSGIGGAVQTGFIYAAEHGYDIAFQFDGDGQHFTSEVEKIVAPVADGKADMVIGSRFLGPGTAYQGSKLRRLGMRLFEAINTVLIGQRVTDNTSGFRAYSRRAINFLAQHYPEDYPEPEAVILLGRNGFTIREVSVAMGPRLTGRSSIGLVRGSYYMTKVLLTLFMNVLRRRIREG